MNYFYSCLMVGSIFLLAACQEDAPTDLPRNISVKAGENLAALTWDKVDGRDYWVFYKQGNEVSLDDKEVILRNVSSPLMINRLINDNIYSFSVASSINGSPVGPLSPSISITPRLLGPEIAWFENTPLTSNNLLAIAYGLDTYVITGTEASLFIAEYRYSENSGVTEWLIPTTLPVDESSTNLSAVFFDGSRFMVLGDNGTLYKNTDSTFLIWEQAQMISAVSGMNALVRGVGVYIAVGDNGLIYSNASDGATAEWNLQISNTTEHLVSVAFVNNRFIAVGENGVLLHSTDGINWESQLSNTMNTLRGVAFGLLNYVAIGDAGTVISSSDAINWVVQSLPTTESFRSLVFGQDNQFIAVGTAGLLAYSSTGNEGTWTTSNAGSVDLNHLTSNFVFIAVGDAGVNVSGK